MCTFKSGIILKNKVVLTPEGNESHSDLLENLGIEDSQLNAMRRFIRAELIPKDGNKATDVSEWTFRVDQDITPDWYNADPKRYEDEFREAVRDYMKEYTKNKVVICGYIWTPIIDGNKTIYLMDGIYKKSVFGGNNNYAESYVRKDLNNSDLAKALKEKFGDRLVPTTTDLTSLDGFDTYGKVEGDILAIPTLDFYRKHRRSIPNIGTWHWLATPHSTPEGIGSVNVCFVFSGGDVCYRWYYCDGGVRGLFILKS